MTHLPPYLQPRSVFWYANVRFIFFASDLHLSFHICTTYLQETNLKSFFFRPKPCWLDALQALSKLLVQ